jgi:glycine hydroxymethyltransferase
LSVWSRGTDVHLVVADLRSSQITGSEAQDRLEQIGITANRNAVPFDPRPPMVSSGVRIGTPALATRGLGVPEFTELGDIIRQALTHDGHLRHEELSAKCAEIAARFPLYSWAEPSQARASAERSTIGGNA